MVLLGKWRGIGVWGILLMAVLSGCAGKRGATEGSEKRETAERLLFLANVQGNPICLFGSIQKMRVFPWMTSPRTRWRAHTWLVVPGAARTLFAESGKRKPPPSVPLTWTKDTLLFTTDQDRLVYFQPFLEEKLLLLSEGIFPERVRKSGDEDVHYSLLPCSVTWNNQDVQGRLFYQKQERSAPSLPAGSLPWTGLSAGGRAYAIWVPGGVFVYLEEQGEGGGGSAVALMEDRRGRWQETYDVTISEAAPLLAEGAPLPGAPGGFRFEIPYWRIQGDLEVIPTDGRGKEEAGGVAVAAAVPPAEGNRLLWASLDALPEPEGRSPVRFCLLKGSMLMDGETVSVYGVGITEP